MSSFRISTTLGFLFGVVLLMERNPSGSGISCGQRRASSSEARTAGRIEQVRRRRREAEVHGLALLHVGQTVALRLQQLVAGRDEADDAAVAEVFDTLDLRGQADRRELQVGGAH